MIRKADETQNKFFKNDVDYAVVFTRWLLKPVGVWPARRSVKKWEMNVTCVLATMNFGLVIFLMAPTLARLYVIILTENTDAFLKPMPPTLFDVMYLIKFWTLVIRKEGATICLERMEDDWEQVNSEEDRQVMKRSAKIGRNFTVLCASLMIGGSIPLNVVAPLLARRAAQQNNSTHRPLPHPSSYVFFDDQVSPLNEILFVTQAATTFIVVLMNCGVYSFAAVCVMHACGQFRIVSRHLELLVEKEDVFAMREQVANVVERHTRAFGYAENIENTLNVVFLSDMIGCTVIMCLLEYLLMKDLELGETMSFVTNMTLITGIAFNVFILSYIGQLLKDQSERVEMVTTSIEWYRLPRDIARNLILLMIRSNRPARLTGGKIFELSYNTFTDVIKTSVMYLNILRTLVA